MKHGRISPGPQSSSKLPRSCAISVSFRVTKNDKCLQAVYCAAELLRLFVMLDVDVLRNRIMAGVR